MVETNKITNDYQQMAQQLCEEQITLGGYRMADFIENIFNNN